MTPTEFLEALPLFRDPILAGGIAGLCLGLLGIFIVLRRMIFLSAALAQSAALGVALTFYAEILLDAHFNTAVGAVACALLAGGILLVSPERLRTTREALLGLVFVGAGALSVLVGSRIAQEAHDIHAILFGSAVLVRAEDLGLLALGGTVSLLFCVLAWRGLLAANFDPEGARVQGIPVGALTTTLFLVFILLHALATRALGMLPVFAFSTLPAMTALALTSNLYVAAVLAASFGLLAGSGGYVAAFFGDYPVGATQTLTLAGLAAAAYIYRLARRG